MSESKTAPPREDRDRRRPKGPAPAKALGYAHVALNRPLDHTLSYSIPGQLAKHAKLGAIVRVPLRGQSAEGVIVGIADRPGFKGPVKPLTQVLTPGYALSDELLGLARWVSDYYWCAWGEALASASFIGLTDVHDKTSTFLALASPEHWLGGDREQGPDGKKITPQQSRVVHALLARGNDGLAPAMLAAEAGVSASVLKTMEKRAYLDRVEEEVLREDDYLRFDGHLLPAPTLTPLQSTAVERILEPVKAHDYKAFVLHGVTGSGKTEVFLRAIEEALRLGRSAIVLVPEISLTPQTVQVFRSRLGDLVGVYHSRMTLGQKYDLWKRIVAGTVRVVVGARSAVFAPMPALGVIVVDEEHESTYKQSETPRYHARDVAVVRAAKLGAVAILASATPSLESMYNAREGKYELLEMPLRVGPHASPVMTVVDMKRHLAETGAESALGPISPPLMEAIRERVRRGEQVVLLLNRRGFANQVMCLRCEKPLQCPHCDVSLTYHKPVGRLECHWCGYQQPVPDVCPKCNEPEVQPLGLGTQRVEEVLAEQIPEARTIRIDLDTMKGRRAFIEAWQKVKQHEVDIILGTQMIAKGFHLEAVTLVGVVSADFALFLPDFRAGERTYALLTQVAGRAGRGDRAGEVILQTYMPHAYAIDLAARLEHGQFYERELHIRRMLRFPPIGRLISVLLYGEDLILVREQIGRLANMLKSLARRPAFEEVKVLGPAPAPIARLEDRHRWRVLLRGTERGPLHKLLHEGLAAFEPIHQKSKVHVTIDVDPVDLM